ncbi:MAG: hypothetical protein AAF738_07170, partial [Bacteroidota bacterium]
LGEEESYIKNYLVSRLGIRLFPLQEYFYADASFGWSFNLSSTDTRTLGTTEYSAKAGGFIYFLQLGIRLPI